jgi:hypothetical protein
MPLPSSLSDTKLSDTKLSDTKLSDTKLGGTRRPRNDRSLARVAVRSTA